MDEEVFRSRAVTLRVPGGQQSVAQVNATSLEEAASERGLQRIDLTVQWSVHNHPKGGTTCLLA